MTLAVDPCSTDLSELHSGELESQIASFSSNLSAAMCRWLLLIAEFDRRQGYVSWECRGTAEWMSFRCGIDTVTARQHVRVANRLKDMPKVTEAFSLGRLSYSQVRAVSRVATRANEEYLLHAALHLTASQLERLVRSYRGVIDTLSSQDSDERYRARSVHHHQSDDGSVVMVLKLPPEQAELVLDAIDREEKRLRKVRGKDSEEEIDPSSLRADALVNLVETASRVATGSRYGSERNMVVIHVDERTLENEGGGVCETKGGSSISAETAKAIACDATIQKVFVGKSGQVQHATSARRSPPTWMRRVLRHRDVTCKFPGCDEDRFLDAHHIKHWAEGGPTTLTNLVQLCWFHHQRVHDAKWRVVSNEDQGFAFLRPDGTVVVGPDGEHQNISSHDSLTNALEKVGAKVKPDACVNDWQGERLPLHYLIEDLARIDGL